MTSLPDATSAVTVSSAVDGTRKGRGKDQHPRTSKPVSTRVHPVLWEAAKAAKREGERLRVLSETEVVLEPER